MKVPLEQTRASQGAQGVCGVLGAIKEHKKEELVAYINSAKQLVHDYIPLTAQKIQQATSNGYMSVQVRAGYDVLQESGQMIEFC